MFDDILGSMNQQQAELEEKLKKVELVKNSPNEELQVVVNAKKEVLDITINKKFEDNGELEDLLVLTLNDAFKEADIHAEKETQNLLNNIMPGGLDGLKGMFG